MSSTHRSLSLISSAIALVAVTVSCASEPKVQVPPRVELARYGTIGIIGFSARPSADHGPQATQLFVHMLQSAQPGAPILELGTRDEVLAKIGHDELDFEAVRTIGEVYRVDAVFSGELEISKAKTNVQIGAAFNSLQASSDLNGKLDARLMETRAGATVWSKRGLATANLANVGVAGGGALPSFGVTDKADVERGLVSDLVARVRGDFYPRWVKQSQQ